MPTGPAAFLEKRGNAREEGVGRLGLRGDQLANMRDIAPANGPTLTGQNRCHGNRVTSQSHELNLEAFAAAMDMHDCADIAGFQTLGRKVGSEHNAVVFLNVHESKG
jgi:hypothetical protein